MKKFYKVLVLFVVITTLLASPVYGYGEPPGVDMESQEDMESFYASLMISSMMDLIMENYTGGELSQEELLHSALKGLGEVLDPYSFYMTEEEFEYYIEYMESSLLLFGMSIGADEEGNFLIISIEDNSSLLERGIQEGDVLERVNGIPVRGLESYEVLMLLNEREDDTARITVRHGEETVEADIEKRLFLNQTVFVQTMDEIFEFVEPGQGADIRRVYISTVGQGTADEMADILANFKAEGVTKIIVDLRNNDGGYFHTAIDICRMLVSKGPVVTRISKSEALTVFYSSLEQKPFEEIVVLTDPYTASAAEIIASTLQDDGAVVVGQQSFGKGIIQEIFDINGFGYLKLTTGEYLRRSGEKIHGIGITPDIPVALPEYLVQSLETMESDILSLKQILAFCGYEVGPMDSEYDSVTRQAVREFKASVGLEENEEIDVYLKVALNNYYETALYNTDLAMETAFDYFDGTVKEAKDVIKEGIAVFD